MLLQCFLSSFVVFVGDVSHRHQKSLSISPILKLQRLELPKSSKPRRHRNRNNLTSYQHPKCNPTAAASTRPQVAPHHPPTPPQPQRLPDARANQTSTARSFCKQASCPRPPDQPTTNCHPRPPPPPPATTATTSSCNHRPQA
jgi:hypothetical protein